MLQHAFKEWAVICEALGQGRQTIILRKGGIAEPEGKFAVAQTQFALYPTYVHQQEDGIQEEARPLLQDALAKRPTPGKIRLELWAEVTGAYHIREELPALLLSHLHYWSEDAVRKRFHYRQPGLFALVVRVYRLPAAIDLDEAPSYEGCRSWVTLEKPFSTEGSTPVLDDESFRVVNRQLDMLLSPTAFA